MNNPTNKNAGPDPAVLQAIQRLSQTQLTPLEEVIFQSWLGANQLEGADENVDTPFDYRGLYKSTGGKVFAPGELKNKIDHQNAMETMMKAQEAHDASSPIKLMMDAQNNAGSIEGMMDGLGDYGSQPEPGPVDNLG